MKVIVTGGCGLVGYHAAMYYHRQGAQVIVIDNLERSRLLGHAATVSLERISHNKRLLEAEGIKVFTLDITDNHTWNGRRGSMNNADLIVHMAGQCGVPTSIESPRRDFEVNTLGTLNVLEFARRNGSAVVFASTNKVYPLHEGFVKTGDRWGFEDVDWARHGFPVVPDLVGARTPYGNSKMMADLMCQEWVHTYGVRTGVFRMSCIYGPNQMGFEEQGWAVWFLIATMKGWPLTIYGDGDQTRDMLYVEDAVRAYDSFFRSDLSHGVWNLGGGPGQTLTLREHLDITERLTGKRSPVTYADWRPLDQKAYVSDIRQIKADLGWEPKIGVGEGLRFSRNWVADNLEVF